MRNHIGWYISWNNICSCLKIKQPMLSVMWRENNSDDTTMLYAKTRIL